MAHTEGKNPLGAQIERRAMLDAAWAAAFGVKFAMEMEKPWENKFESQTKHAGYEAAIVAEQAYHAAKEHLDEHLAEAA